jgi:DNA-binding HxlR family transcriptional regulator
VIRVGFVYFKAFLKTGFMAYNRKMTLDCDINSSENCALEAALSIIGGKWKLKIYKALRNGGNIRFSAIHKSLEDISEKTLTAQLREMENDGVITRTSYPEIPPRVEYALTDLGTQLEPVFDSLNNWGKAYVTGRSALQATEGLG